MKKLNSLNLGNDLNRSEMKNVFGGRSLSVSPEEGSCKEACTSCDGNSQCCSGVCATDQPGCGGGRKCLK